MRRQLSLVLDHGDDTDERRSSVASFPQPFPSVLRSDFRSDATHPDEFAKGNALRDSLGSLPKEPNSETNSQPNSEPTLGHAPRICGADRHALFGRRSLARMGELSDMGELEKMGGMGELGAMPTTPVTPGHSYA